MYAVTHGITRCHPAAAAAMLVFTLAPPRIQYAVEFQMEIMFGLPLAVYALVRYFETQRARYLVAFLVAFWLQAIAVWYFAVILGSGLVVLALSYALRHWSGWRGRTMLASAAGIVALGAALAPVAWPFFVTRAELGLQRGIADAVGRSADVLSYVTTDGVWLGQLLRISHGHETSLFPGLVAYGLAGLAMMWLRHARRAETARGWPERLTDARDRGQRDPGRADASWVGGGIGFGSAWTRLPSLTAAASLLLACLLLRDALAGWRRWQAGLATRRLTEGEWVSTLGAMGLLAWLLSLGPVVPVAGVATGSGLYAWLHPYVFPLRAIRGTTRFGLLVLLVVALLAGLGVAWLWGRLRGRGRTLAMAAVLLALALDYVHTPQRYQWIASWTRPVDAVLRADPDDVAVLEWRLGNRRARRRGRQAAIDRAWQARRQRLRRIRPWATDRALSGLLAASTPAVRVPGGPDRLGADLFPALPARAGAGAALARPTGGRGARRSVRPASCGSAAPTGRTTSTRSWRCPERGHVLERWMAYDLLVSRPVLRARVQTDADRRRRRPVDRSSRSTARRSTRAPLDGGASLSATLTQPLHRAAPNVIEIEHDYRRALAARGPEHRIGSDRRDEPGRHARPERRPAPRRRGLDPDRDGRGRTQPARLQPGGPRSRGRPPGPHGVRHAG